MTTGGSQTAWSLKTALARAGSEGGAPGSLIKAFSRFQPFGRLSSHVLIHMGYERAVSAGNDLSQLNPQEGRCQHVEAATAYS
jgi:hypothetical protein